MKILSKLFLIILFFIATDKLIRTQTDGFRLEKTQSDYEHRQEWIVDNPELESDTLNQPFYFLGSGVQCYAFLGEDNKTVLKVFKHYHMGPSSTLLKKIPLPRFLLSWQQTLLDKREKRITSIFTSAIIALRDLSKQTGVFFLNINKTQSTFPTIVIYDKIGIRNTLDLNTTPFLLQKKATPFFPYLEQHPDETAALINSLFDCITNRTRAGISNSDPAIRKNFGILDGKVIEIDVGSFSYNPFIRSSLLSKREIFYQTLEVKEWVNKHTPELSDYFEQRLFQAIRL